MWGSRLRLEGSGTPLEDDDGTGDDDGASRTLGFKFCEKPLPDHRCGESQAATLSPLSIPAKDADMKLLDEACKEVRAVRMQGASGARPHRHSG